MSKSLGANSIPTYKENIFNDSKSDKPKYIVFVTHP